MESESSKPVTSLPTDLTREKPSLDDNGMFCFSIGIFVAAGGALVVNTIVISAVLKTPDLRQKNSSKMILSFLVSSILIVSTAMTVIALSWYEEGKYIHPSVMAVLFALVWDFVIARNLTSCTLALTRLSSMLWPFTYQRIMKDKSIFFVLAPWLLSALLGIPALYGVLGVPNIKTFEYVYPPNQTVLHEIAMKTYVFVSIGVPVIVTCIAYGIMFYKVSKVKRSGSVTQGVPTNHHISKWRSGVTRALLANLTSILCFNIPHILVHMTNLNKESAILPVIHLLYALQYILDPMMFVIFAQQYRQACVHLFRGGNPEMSRVSDES
ncbi:protein trapped in endoderm-1-like [Palaemon carinicauda]|uniref:protein trapped in endoderm-1-like n=1 Tax=Palaemon carinicauda TaxID=392227 RepID=UPI0035B68E77